MCMRRMAIYGYIWIYMDYVTYRYIYINILICTKTYGYIYENEIMEIYWYMDISIIHIISIYMSIYNNSEYDLNILGIIACNWECVIDTNTHLQEMTYRPNASVIKCNTKYAYTYIYLYWRVHVDAQSPATVTRPAPSSANSAVSCK